MKYSADQNSNLLLYNQDDDIPNIFCTELADSIYPDSFVLQGLFQNLSFPKNCCFSKPVIVDAFTLLQSKNFVADFATVNELLSVSY